MGSSSNKKEKNKKRGYEEEIRFKNNYNLKKEQSDKINSQMEKNICKIIIKNTGSGTGFFCMIPISSKSDIKAIVTNNHVLGIDDIAPGKSFDLIINNSKEEKTLYIGETLENRKLYTSYDYDITIIEIKDSDKLGSIEFFKIVPKIVEEKEAFLNYKNREVYVLHYPGESNCEFSYGKLEILIDDINIDHYCDTEHGSSGSPIIDFSDYKVIGIHKGSIGNKKNVGTFLKYPILEIQDLNEKGILDNYARLKTFFKEKEKEKNKEKKNEIKIKLSIDKCDIGQKVYFLGNYKDHENYNELNGANIKMKIKDKIQKNFEKYFIPEKEGEYNIKLEFKIKIKDCSYMFYNCPNIISLDLSSFDTQNVSNMNHMFGRCYNVKEIILIDFITNKVNDMSYMFLKCKSLCYLDLYYFKTENVNTMCCMFQECFDIMEIKMPLFNTINVKDMSNMFCKCYKLKELDLSSFNTTNVTNMGHMFDECCNLENIKTSETFFNTEKAYNMCHMFRRCNNLNLLDLLKFKTQNVNYLSYMFSECSKLTDIDLSKFNTQNVTDMTFMFSECKNLSYIDLSSFSFEKINKLNNMFDNCLKLKKIKINKKWKKIIKEQNENIKSIDVIF